MLEPHSEANNSAQDDYINGWSVDEYEHHDMSSSTTSLAPSPPPPPIPEEHLIEGEVALIPCGHIADCMSCLINIKDSDGLCPICRSQIDQVVKIYAV
ncbi:Zinc finger, RING/FYVE/PHD-type [Parasponia andersonii]|uniref:Zinc finger, RING/FYVE/PHD-type n=1 Tax=Parasponia andersonii TaxID=3476 RepID=A0A2P5CV16_PARAD|nr:Zinc finger, RING/FYVE/PHD-type [Parasponia andersonii]